MEDVAKFFQGFGAYNFNPIESSNNPAQLVVLKQSAPSIERVTSNGIQKDVYVVIKNSPFVVTLGCSSAGAVNFNHVAFNCTLHYDVEGEKTVDFIKDRPLQFKATPNERGDQVNIELRLKVLTSQHEDMFFLVSIHGHDPHTKEPIQSLTTFTHPIKVISKPEQLKKREPTKRRTVNETIIDIMTNIEKTQRDHSEVLSGIYNKVVGEEPATNKQQQQQQQQQQQRSNKRRAPDTEPEAASATASLTTTKATSSFEESFSNMLRNYTELPMEQRGVKVRKLLNDLGSEELLSVCQLIDMVTAEGIYRDSVPQPIKTLSETLEMGDFTLF